MDSQLAVLLGGIIVFAVFVLFVFTFIHKQGSKLDKDFYRSKWADIDAASTQQIGWIQAIIEADKLLDDALKKSGYKGKTMGERLVSASRAFSDNDRTWGAHKLRNKVVHETSLKLRKNHVESALSAFKKSLKDLGAL